MKKVFVLLFLLASTASLSFGQTETSSADASSRGQVDTLSVVIPPVKQKTVDTLYYDKNWKGTDDKTFCTYYRVYALNSKDNFSKRFRDFYATGEIRAEGTYISVDKYDDANSVFDGELITYDKAGKVLEKKSFDDGKLSGEYCKYSDDGLLLVHSYYKNGKLDGICTEFSENGTECVQIEYDNGEPINDCCIISNSEGLCSKITLSTRKPIYESPSLDEKQVEYIKGESWPYYNKNGIMISITNQAVRDYGKYYKIPILIANNTMFPFDIDPDNITALMIDKKGKSQDLRVYSSDEYMKKVKRRQNAALFFTALGEGMAAASAGKSASTTTSSYSGTARSGGKSASYRAHSTSTTVSYDGAAAYQAQLIASDRVANFSNALLSEREAKEEGYLKRTTVHPGETISGYVHVERKKGETININVDINGAIYTFNWHIGK